MAAVVKRPEVGGRARGDGPLQWFTGDKGRGGVTSQHWSPISSQDEICDDRRP